MQESEDKTNMFKHKFRRVLKVERTTILKVADALGKSPQTIYNILGDEGKETETGKLSSLKYSTAEEMLDALGYEIVFRNKETGAIID